MEIKKAERNYSIDLLRILAMMMIIVMHQMSHGGGTEVYDDISLNSIIARFLHALCVVGVNLYVLISAYFLVNEKFRFSKVIHIVLETWFYSWGIFLIFKLSNQDIASMKNSLLPISFAQNWFITEYIGMYMLFPFCNVLIKAMSQKQHKSVIIVLLALLSIWSDIIPSANPFGTSPGATTFWFLAVYMTGGYIRLYVDLTQLRKKSTAVYFISSIIITLSWVVIIALSKLIPGISHVSDYYYRYNCIFVMVSSVALFCLFINIKIRNKPMKSVIKIVSPLTLGVYLIHDNPNIRAIIWGKIFIKDTLLSSPLYIVQFIGRVVCVCIVCAFIDYLRTLLFNVFEKRNLYIKAMQKIDKIIEIV